MKDEFTIVPLDPGQQGMMSNQNVEIKHSCLRRQKYPVPFGGQSTIRLYQKARKMKTLACLVAAFATSN